MSDSTAQEVTSLSIRARQAVLAQNWQVVDTCAKEILRREPGSAEGHFLTGLVLKVSGRPVVAASSFEKTLEIDPERYDAAVELASQYSVMRRNGDAADLLDRYCDKMDNSPMYLDLAGTTYSDIGLNEKAWSLQKKATTLQPKVDLFQANLAATSVYLGKVDEAEAIYKHLLERLPQHRHNHYLLSRLRSAKDDSHVKQMKEVLAQSSEPPNRNIYIYYAIAKELEDLERWEESFQYYKQAGDAVMSVADYNLDSDIQLIDKIIEVCNAEWLAEGEPKSFPKTPIFIVGLPRTGTTLTERIIGSHSSVQSLGETQFLQMQLRQESGVSTVEGMNADIVGALAPKDLEPVASGYLDSVAYRLGEEPFFIEKLPFNYLFLGFIAKAFADARIVFLHRHPIDACFSMYKQVFTWAYKFSYSLETLAQYYVAYDRLRQHWQSLLGDRMIEVDYETLVANQEDETRKLLDRLGLPFEEACLEFDSNAAPSTTASSVQVREKVYTTSVQRWRKFERELEPLTSYLRDAGIDVD